MTASSTPRRLLCALGLLALTACPRPPASPPSLKSGPHQVQFAPDAGTFTLSRGDATLLRFDADAFQLGTVRALDDTLSYDPFWLFTDSPTLVAVTPPGLRWRTPTSAVVTQTSATEIHVQLGYESNYAATLTLSTADDGRFAAKLVPTTPDGANPIAFFRLKARCDDAEGLYGLGEWFDGVNHRGHLRPMQLEPELAVESAYTENHVTVPLLVGSRGWGLFVASNRFGVFDVARTEGNLIDTTWSAAGASDAGLEFHLLAAEHPLDVLAPYYRLTGFPRLPAPWALGPWIWRDENRDQAEVLDDIQQIRARDLATSGLWIDRPYATAVNTFDFDATKFTDAPAMIRAAHDAGLRVALWHSPYLEPTATPYRTQADANGYFPPTSGVLLNHWGVPLDFTLPAAVTFWKTNLAKYTAVGIEGYKLDYGEDVVAGLSGRGTGWRFADGSTERTMTRDYTLLYHRTYRETLPNDGFILARAGKWGDQVNGLIIWPGDIDARLTAWEEAFTDRSGGTVTGVGGLASAIRAGVGLSMSGFPFFAADTGGYRHSPPDRETFVRWTEQSALGTAMETGDSSSQPPWVFTAENGRDDAALDVYRRYARLKLRLFPYVWTHAQRIATTGRSIQRPFGIAFPQLGAHPSDEYLLGDDLLVAPVEKYAQTTKTLVAPPAAWVQWFDGSVLDAEGQTVTVNAALEVLPLYARRGALIPMLRPTIDTLAPATDPGVESFANDAGPLFVRVVPGADGHFEVYDGTVLAQAGRGGVLTLKATKGSVFTSSVVFEVVVAARPSSVSSLVERADLATLLAQDSGWTFAAGTLWIKSPLDAVLTVN